MRIARLTIENFRGIKFADLKLPEHSVLIGDNNTGKTTLLEALDLVLGPDRLNRYPAIDEHDFFRGIYTSKSTQRETEEFVDAPEESSIESIEGEEHQEVSPAPQIKIEVLVVNLTEEQKRKFGDFVEFWDCSTGQLYDQPDPAGVDLPQITEALRVTFIGAYNEEDDDFEGNSFFTRSLTENDKPEPFKKQHKQVCGFLFLRSLRTGSRALSLERGSLLDIILRLKEVRPGMWEDTINTLSSLSVAGDPALGVLPVLESISAALKKYVPKEWGVQPHLRVSNLTREHLRKVITAFMATGDGDHAAPFNRQGTGTINMLVLAMLSQIAEDKQNVIFAMEEPETAIPPYAQKRIVHEVRKLSSQAIFTSHSPYVLEEFAVEETIVLSRDSEGNLGQKSIDLPANVKPKRYRQEFRTRFAEGLLARRILIAEGATEASAFPVACRRLSELAPETYSPLEALGICVVDAGGEGSIPAMAKLYLHLGKRIFAICDKQSVENEALIREQVELLLMHEQKGFEDLVIHETTQDAMQRFVGSLDLPSHLSAKYSKPVDEAAKVLKDYFSWAKGDLAVADFLAQCAETEIPEWIRDGAIRLKEACVLPLAFVGEEQIVEEIDTPSEPERNETL